MTDVESVVIVDEIKTSSNDYTIGRLTLNKPKALNALDLEMAGIMLDALQRWQSGASMRCKPSNSNRNLSSCYAGNYDRFVPGRRRKLFSTSLTR